MERAVNASAEQAVVEQARVGEGERERGRATTDAADNENESVGERENTSK